MRNIIGSPAEGDNFFDRPKVLERLLQELDDRANILLVAPRRVGKTSLVIRLCERWRVKGGRKAVFFDIEGERDELAFAEKLIDELGKAGLNPQMLTRAIGIFGKIRQGLGGGIKVPGMEVSLGEAAEADLPTLGKVLESVFRKIEEGEGDESVLIAIDELPEFLITLRKADRGAERVATFLSWLRSLRQTFREKVSWLFLGSIGLDNFVEAELLQHTINDLVVFSLDAFSAKEADDFLDGLGTSYQLALTDADRREIVERVGWPLAYYLQLVFHELRYQESLSIHEAIESLLRPQNYSYFETWNQRLDKQFSGPDADTCKAILRRLCREPGGCGRDQILAELMAKPSADVVKVEEQLSSLLATLQRDGYLLESDGRYGFRSFLLREYWHRKYVR